MKLIFEIGINSCLKSLTMNNGTPEYELDDMCRRKWQAGYWTLALGLYTYIIMVFEGWSPKGTNEWKMNAEWRNCLGGQWMYWIATHEFMTADLLGYFVDGCRFKAIHINVYNIVQHSIRSNICQIHHMMHSYIMIYLFIYNIKLE